LGSWTLYLVNAVSGISQQLATANGVAQLSELPYPTVGNGFVLWDELIAPGQKVLLRYDLTSKTRSQVGVPSGMYPVRPSISGQSLLFLDNSRDPGRAAESWYSRGGEPVLMNLGTGQISYPAPSSVVFEPVLTAARAVWWAGGSNSDLVQELTLPAGEPQTLAQDTSVTRLWASDHVTIWLSGTRGAVTARVGDRTAVVAADLTSSPGGMALCGSQLYYAGPQLSLKVASIE
jgi:hypothetical protein